MLRKTVALVAASRRDKGTQAGRGVGRVLACASEKPQLVRSRRPAPEVRWVKAGRGRGRESVHTVGQSWGHCTAGRRTGEEPSRTRF